ncbi:hypothetical protein LCGC14_1767180 [marine sediment metagenome]|uniref:Uncharacterized protein n=1 Tax=marine sediment metagenome TaxID=412755 RepID=A0A0F9HLU2_9ZZZZ
MNLDDFKEILSISKIREKIFRIKELYHPNLVKNLSKEAYDLYLIRQSICDQLLELSNKKLNNPAAKGFIILFFIKSDKVQGSSLCLLMA